MRKRRTNTFCSVVCAELVSAATLCDVRILFFSVASQDSDWKKKSRRALSNSALNAEVFCRRATHLRWDPHPTKRLNEVFDKAATHWLTMRRRRLYPQKRGTASKTKTSLLEAFRCIAAKRKRKGCLGKILRTFQTVLYAVSLACLFVLVCCCVMVWYKGSLSPECCCAS